MEFGKNGEKLNQLFKYSLTFWTSACTKFQSHSSGKSEIHSAAVIAIQEFTKMMRNQLVPIDQQLNEQMHTQERENRERIKSIIKTIIFCGQINIPL